MQEMILRNEAWISFLLSVLLVSYDLKKPQHKRLVIIRVQQLGRVTRQHAHMAMHMKVVLVEAKVATNR